MQIIARRYMTDVRGREMYLLSRDKFFPNMAVLGVSRDYPHIIGMHHVYEQFTCSFRQNL